METAARYLNEIARRLSDPSLADQLGPAVDAVLASYRKGGLTYVFGTGHSHLLGLELHYRAGGPAFVVPILDDALMLHQGAIASTAREREAGRAEDVLRRYAIGSKDVMIVVSNSGVNAVPVEAARFGRDAGATVIALTSRAYAAASADGRTTISDIAHMVIDNGLPPGDALVELPGTPLKVGPGSTAIGAALLQGLFAEVAARLALEGETPIFLSANMPGATENNRELVDRYQPLNPHL